MAFECTVDIVHSVLHYDVFRQGEEYSVLIRVGKDVENKLNYFLNVGLSPTGGGSELYFNIIEVNSLTGEEVVYWCGSETKSIIDEECRGIIILILLKIVDAIINSAKPEYVYLIPREPALPEKAMIKYMRIVHVFHTRSYTVRKTDPHRGRRMWTMSIHEDDE